MVKISETVKSVKRLSAEQLFQQFADIAHNDETAASSLVRALRAGRLPSMPRPVWDGRSRPGQRWSSAREATRNRSSEDNLCRPGRCDVHTNAVSDTGTGRLHRLVCKMRIARRGLDLGVSEQFPDHRKALSEGQSAGREAVTQVMDSHVVKVGSGADAAPRVL